jgi:hypothetical protein
MFFVTNFCAFVEINIVKLLSRTTNAYHIYKACPSESGTEVGAPLFPAVELCDFGDYV